MGCLFYVDVLCREYGESKITVELAFEALYFVRIMHLLYDILTQSGIKGLDTVGAVLRTNLARAIS